MTHRLVAMFHLLVTPFSDKAQEIGVITGKGVSKGTHPTRARDVSRHPSSATSRWRREVLRELGGGVPAGLAHGASVPRGGAHLEPPRVPVHSWRLSYPILIRNFSDHKTIS